MNTSYNITDHHYDVVVVGAGGSGLRATLGCAESGLKTACIESFPNKKSYSCSSRWHRCRIGQYGDDNWKWHMYDTVKVQTG